MKVPQCRDQQQRPGHERERERELHDGEAGPETTRAGCQPAAAVGERAHGALPKASTAGAKPAARTASDGDQERQREHAHVERHVPVLGEARHEERHEERLQPEGKSDADGRAGERQHRALGEPQQREAASMGAEREADHALAPHADAPQHHHVGDVGAAEQEQRAADGHEHATRGAAKALALEDVGAEPLEQTGANLLNFALSSGWLVESAGTITSSSACAAA